MSEASPISRSLLLPGPLPPLSHLGATLLRRVIGAGLRYALYHLGLPLPEEPPVRILLLRPYLDRPALARLLEPVAGGAEVVAALCEPEGAAGGPLPRRLLGATVFHRLRLRIGGRRLHLSRPETTGAPEALWDRLQGRMDASAPAVHDALLGELLAALARRQRRRRRQQVVPCLGEQAWRYELRRPADLAALGLPDPAWPSWAADSGTPAPSGPGAAAAVRCHGRGAWRERYRRSLEPLREILLALGARATAHGVLAEPSDAFFLPFEVAADLVGAASGRPSGWMAPAVESNRREHAALWGVIDAAAAARAPLWPLD